MHAHETLDGHVLMMATAIHTSSSIHRKWTSAFALQPSSMRETFPSHGFVVAASTVSAAVAIGIAVVVSELLRREFAKLQHEDTQKSAAHALHHVDVSSIAGFSRGLERRSTEESLESAARARHVSKDSLVPGFRGEDSTFRSVNPELMARGRSSKPRLVGENWAPYQTRVVRIALTGGPCAGKSSALEHLIEHATAEGFDVLTAPEVATLYMNTGYSFPSASSETFLEEKCAAKRHLRIPTARRPADGLLTACRSRQEAPPHTHRSTACCTGSPSRRTSSSCSCSSSAATATLPAAPAARRSWSSTAACATAACSCQRTSGRVACRSSIWPSPVGLSAESLTSTSTSGTMAPST